jgi:hypothetical protein
LCHFLLPFCGGGCIIVVSAHSLLYRTIRYNAPKCRTVRVNT